METIKIQGARLHNLKNINLSIPKQQLVVMTGISGSGKSSLAFDILFEEGKNQYLRSIGILAGLDQEDRFDTIEGLGPTVAIRQNTIRQSNPRSTVGTKSGILNQLAFLFSSDGRFLDEERKPLSPSHFLYTTGEGMCIQCQGKGSYYEVDQEQLVSDRTTTLLQVYEKNKVTTGFLRLLKKRYERYFDTPFWELPEKIREEVVYGTFENGKQSYCIERILRSAHEKGEDVEKVYVKSTCASCHGERIVPAARKVYLNGKRIGELGQMTLSGLFDFLTSIPQHNLSQFGKNVVKNLIEKLKHLIQFRLGHLSLYREMGSLSGGELQRMFLHLHLESKLDSLIYIFDEPMVGLHPSEKQRMIEAIKELRDLGNTVLVVEHDQEMIQHADHIIEIGPKAGIEGGDVVFQGTYDDYKKANTLLSSFISDSCRIPELRRKKFTWNPEDLLTITHANTHYLKDITVSFPLHAMVGIAGLSGSGKSTLIEETLLKRLMSTKKYGDAAGIFGTEHIDDFVVISQEPIGRSASSTPASYIGIWEKIRELFAKQPEAKLRNMEPGHFSFHSKGACKACGGSGYERIYLTSEFTVDKLCPVCHGKRFQEESLFVVYQGKTIADVLELSIADAINFFSSHECIVKPLHLLKQMGMGYLTLGQPTISLSGGEAQRLKLAKALGQQRKSNLLYVLDEPTAGLSLYDTALLLQLLQQLIASGNSILVIEHNVEILKRCDYIIELGPEGGEKGGEVIAKGTPKQLRAHPNSKTGRYLV